MIPPETARAFLADYHQARGSLKRVVLTIWTARICSDRKIAPIGLDAEQIRGELERIADEADQPVS